MNQPADSTAIKLTEDMKLAVNSAFGTGKPIAIAYVDENSEPQLSYRGSTQAFSDTQLAIWVRNPAGRILESIAKNPSVALVFGEFNPQDRRFLFLRGRARRDDSDAVRNRVYDGSHEFERSQDPERKGIAIIIDLTSVTGFFGGERVNQSNA